MRTLYNIQPMKTNCIYFSSPVEQETINPGSDPDE
jgi:hypothetical protein